MQKILRVAMLRTQRAAEVRADYLILGLGNPGSRYRGTRHNVGFLLIDEFLSRHSGALDHLENLSGGKSQSRLRKKSKNRNSGGAKNIKNKAEAFELLLDERLVVLAKSLTFMNLSGAALKPLIRKYNPPDISRIVIVHDELDLPPGRFKFKQGGGIAGHKGLASIRQVLGSSDFSRLRIGIGKPPHKELGADYVLSKTQEPETHAAIPKAVDLLEEAIFGNS